ncbi:MAG: hypothetical protein HFG42_16270 [Lachnospiraceae bacterium]|jgi:hypothetical protein|nr:hypothetical protein [Lachnospiraceae bacterium]
MGHALLKKTGGKLNLKDLTARPEDVVSPLTFLGSGSDSVQTGVIPSKGSPEYTLPINGELRLAPGSYAGGKVYQQIPTLGQQQVNPGKNRVTVECKDKYMTGNIIVSPIKGLTPEVIKKGEYVGGVGPGLWEGYVNDNPLCPYYNGTFYQGQSAEILTGNPNETLESRQGPYRGYQGTVSFQKQSIRSSHPRDNQITASGIVFNVPYNPSIVEGMSALVNTVTNDSTGGEIRVILAQNKVTNWVRNYVGSYNPALGTVYIDKGVWDKDVSAGFSHEFYFTSTVQEAYLYIIFISRYAQTRDLYIAEFYPL